jgi:hypothetical protein
MIPYKKPMIANVERLSSLSENLSFDEIYFHCDFLKPGNHTYIVKKEI